MNTAKRTSVRLTGIVLAVVMLLSCTFTAAPVMAGTLLAAAGGGLSFTVLSHNTLLVFAEGTGVIAADNVSAKPGETADVAIRAENNPGIVALMLRIDYDPAALTLTSVDNGEVFASNTALFGKDLTATPYTVLWEDGLSTEDHTGDGVLVTLHFTVKNDVQEGDYGIKLEVDTASTFNTDLEKVAFQTQNGTVHIGAPQRRYDTALIVSGIAVIIVVGLTIGGSVMVRKRRIDKKKI